MDHAEPTPTTPDRDCSRSAFAGRVGAVNGSVDITRHNHLLAAFRDTEYRVDTGAGIVAVTIGCQAPELEPLAAGRPWFIITAFNPDGQARANRLNRDADRELRALLKGMDEFIVRPAVNHDASGCWPDEPSWWVAGADDTLRDELARRFGQCAVVVGRLGAPAGLLLYGRGWEFDLPAHACRADH